MRFDIFRPAPTGARPTHREGGLAIAEVLIAAVLLVLVSGAFLQLVVGSTQAQASTKVRQKQQSVSEGLIEQLRVDSKWTKECTDQAAANGALDGACVVQVGELYKDADFAKDPKTGVAYGITATATAVDSEGDGLGDEDEDGSPVDFFEVKTKVAAPKGSNVGELTSTSVVDPFSSVATGSLALDVCAMPGQVDERLVISACDTDLPLDATSVDGGDRAAYDALPIAKRSMQVDPIVSNVRLNGLDDIASVIVNGTTDAKGQVEFDRLKPGRYRVTVLAPPAGLTLWDAKSIPESTISVEPYQAVDAMVAYRREQAPDYTIQLQTGTRPASDLTKHTLGIERDVRIKLLPMPAGRVPIATELAVATYSGAVMTSLVIPKPAPGLYRPMVVNGSGGLEQLYRSNRGVRTTLTSLWIGAPSVPAGGNVDGDGNAANDDAAYYLGIRSASTTPTAPTSTPGAPTSTTPVNTGPDSFTNATPFIPAITLPLACSWKTVATVRTAGFLGAILPPLLSTESNPGMRTCAPCGNISVNHQSLASTVNIHCGLGASCKQTITFSDGKIWFGSTALKGGTLNVWCYQNASCTQSATVAGNKTSNFFCYPNSQCNQTMPASRSWFGATAGGSAEVHCFPNARCTQVGDMPPGATTLARCFPNANCDQRIADGFSWSTSSAALAMECHPRATCRQTAGKTDRFDGLFGGRPAGVLKMVCRADASCDQASFLGNFGGGFDMICNEQGACGQTMVIGSIFGNAGTRQARQTCYPTAKCAQLIDRGSPAGVMDQTCYPQDGLQAAAEAATGPACLLNGSRVGRGWFGITTESTRLQYCATASTCTMNMVSGGWGSFDGRKPYRQLCVAQADCVQNATRYADLFSGITEFSQDCQTSGGSCRQMANIVDDDLFSNGSGIRRQVCDSRTSCTQDMFGGRNRSRLNRDATGRITSVNSNYSFFGTRNDVYQLCNRAITDAPEVEPTTEPEPEGDFDSENGGTGGA